MNQLGTRGAKHLYSMSVVLLGARTKVEVFANNRSQATRIAERAGFVVRDVNMVG